MFPMSPRASVALQIPPPVVLDPSPQLEQDRLPKSLGKSLGEPARRVGLSRDGALGAAGLRVPAVVDRIDLSTRHAHEAPHGASLADVAPESAAGRFPEARAFPNKPTGIGAAVSAHFRASAADESAQVAEGTPQKGEAMRTPQSSIEQKASAQPLIQAPAPAPAPVPAPTQAPAPGPVARAHPADAAISVPTTTSSAFDTRILRQNGEQQLPEVDPAALRKRPLQPGAACSVVRRPARNDQRAQSSPMEAETTQMGSSSSSRSPARRRRRHCAKGKSQCPGSKLS
jgi:hypothetical protein